MEDNVAARLKLYMETMNITPSQFADMCGVSRATLSQILTGRNKKISDVLVGQIHKAFPDLSVLWLLFGEGPVRTVVSAPQDSVMESEEAAFYGNENPEMRPNGNTEEFHSNLTGFKSPKNTINSSKNQWFESDLKILDLQKQIENLRQNPRKVLQITIYYDDSTFETFVPK